MKRGIHLLFQGHRLAGGIIAAFFLMWFLTGLVLIYHPYPRLPDTRLNEMKESLPDSLPSIPEIEARAGGTIRGLSLRQFQGQTLVSVSTDDSSLVYPANTPDPVKPVTFAFVREEARRWVNAPIIRIDTLRERAQWILYSRYDRAMPIYKFYFDDPERHELFISGKTGEAQQLTDRDGRLWAWLGAIPHKFYLPFIRKNLDLWDTSLTIGGALCFLAAASGLAIGLYLCLRGYRKERRLRNPYRRPAHRWHYASGMVFGLFMVTWGISGIFAMQRVPGWLVDYRGKYFFSESEMWGKKPLPMGAYTLDYRLLKKTFPDLKEVTWTRFADVPAYRVIAGKEERLIDASTDTVRPLFLPEQAVRAAVRRLHGEDTAFRLSWMEEYDSYYLSYKRAYPLPVYKVVVDDAVGTRYYIDPYTGDIQYLNRNKMVRRWVFNAFHYLNLKYLVDRPRLWTACVWILCIGGAAVSATGLYLGCRHLRRIAGRRGR